MKKRILFVIAIFLAWLPVFAIQKPVFLLYNYSQAAECAWTDWFRVIWHGLKLDCTMSGYLTAFPLLCVLLSVWLHGAWLKKILKGYFIVMAIAVSALFAVDVALYGFWGFRLDATPLFYLQSPKEAMASIPLLLFVFQLVFFVVYAYGIWWFFKKTILAWTPDDMVRKRLSGSLVMIVLGGILFLPIRGGVTTSTANVGMVYFSNNQFLNHAAINPCFSFMVSLAKQQDFASQFNFFKEEERRELFESVFPPNRDPEQPDVKLLKNSRPNILLILLESFSANVIEVTGGEPDVTPNFNQLSEEGVLFTNMYSNTFRTDRGIVSVLNGYPAQPTTSIMKYPVKSQTLPAIARTLGEEGYVSDMLYGGDINFTNMQSYFFSSGYSKITADRDFPLTQRLNKWGANDDITFTWMYNYLTNRQEEGPWLSTFLTVSSHEPFEVPYNRLGHLYTNSVAFTDSCLGDFIDKLKQHPVWDDLLVIMLSDHGYRYPDGIQEYDPLRYRIPMLWTGGAVKEPAVVETIATQTDLAATLLHQLDLPADEYFFSKDIFNPSIPHYAFYTFKNGFGLIDSTGISVYDNDGSRLLLEEPAGGNELRLNKGKAILQTLYDDLGSR